MKLLLHAIRLGLLAAPVMVFAQSKAHQHGVLALDIVVEARKLTLQMQSPLDNLVGFERAPRNDAERKRVAAALARLEAAPALFVIDPTAQCRLSNVTIASAALGLGAAQPANAKDQHADIEASVEFECQDAARAAFIEVGLFDAFAEMKRIEVRVATPKAQFKRTLTRPARRVALTR